MRLLRCACRQVPVCCLLFTVLKMASQIISDPEHVIDRVCWYPVQPTVVLLVSKLRIFPLDLSEVRVPCSLSVIYRTLLLFFVTRAQFGLSKSSLLTVGDVAGCAADVAPTPDHVIAMGNAVIKTRIGAYATCNTTMLRPAAATGVAGLKGWSTFLSLLVPLFRPLPCLC
jgi:hypothetical protein